MHSVLGMTLAMAAVYLVAVRLVDLNEKEPLWAVSAFFALGAGAAVALHAGVSSVLLELSGAPGVLAKEGARFVAVAGGVGMLVMLAKQRGHLEIDGLLDGVVYGSAGGLGFAVGTALAREYVVRGSSLELAPPSVAAWGQLALGGLSDGVYGALIGVGFAAGIEARRPIGRALAPIGGFVAATIAHLSYEAIARGDALGNGAVTRRWTALLLPVAVVGAVVWVALGRERRAIADELGGEDATGAVSGAELELLTHPLRMQLAGVKLVASGRLREWSTRQDLKNRQVQLALAKQRASGESDAARRAELADQVAQLRAAVLELKRGLGEVGPRADEAARQPENAAGSADPGATDATGDAPAGDAAGDEKDGAA